LRGSKRLMFMRAIRHLHIEVSEIIL